MTNLDFLKETEAWLCFNRWPSREQIGTYKTSLEKQIKLFEQVPQTEVNAFAFAEWAASNYVRLSGCWVSRYADQRNPNNGVSTDTLWERWFTETSQAAPPTADTDTRR